MNLVKLTNLWRKRTDLKLKYISLYVVDLRGRWPEPLDQQANAIFAEKSYNVDLRQQLFKLALSFIYVISVRNCTSLDISFISGNTHHITAPEVTPLVPTTDSILLSNRPHDLVLPKCLQEFFFFGGCV